MAKQTKTENVILESFGNIQLEVTYVFEEVKSTEECHGVHDTSYTNLDISYVELLIAGEVVKVNQTSNLLSSLTPKQINEIESMLQVY
jgi:hypothetical protein